MLTKVNDREVRVCYHWTVVATVRRTSQGKERMMRNHSLTVHYGDDWKAVQGFLPLQLKQDRRKLELVAVKSITCTGFTAFYLDDYEFVKMEDKPQIPLAENYKNPQYESTAHK